MGEEQIASFVQQVDDNCAGPCKTSTQAYGSLIWALTDALTDAWAELEDERALVSE